MAACEPIQFCASARAKQELREAAVTHILRLGPAGPGAQDPGATAALVTRGIDALDGYYSRYLPQLVLAVIVPVAVLLQPWRIHRTGVDGLQPGAAEGGRGQQEHEGKEPRVAQEPDHRPLSYVLRLR